MFFFYLLTIPQINICKNRNVQMNISEKCILCTWGKLKSCPYNWRLNLLFFSFVKKFFQGAHKRCYLKKNVHFNIFNFRNIDLNISGMWNIDLNISIITSCSAISLKWKPISSSCDFFGNWERNVFEKTKFFKFFAKRRNMWFVWNFNISMSSKYWFQYFLMWNIDFNISYNVKYWFQHFL